jgi:hypothetical protein
MSLSRAFRRVKKRRRLGRKLCGWAVEVYRGVSLEVSPKGGLVFIDNPSWRATYSSDSVSEARALVDEIFLLGEPVFPATGSTLH